MLSHAPAPVVEALPFNAKKAIPITETGIQSNLAGQTHYVSFDLQFEVMPGALKSAGGKATASSSTSGTGSAELDAKIRNELIALARSTSYGQLTSSGGLTAFKAQVTEVLDSIFGPGAVGDVYFSNLLTQ